MTLCSTSVVLQPSACPSDICYICPPVTSTLNINRHCLWMVQISCIYVVLHIRQRIIPVMYIDCVVLRRTVESWLVRFSSCARRYSSASRWLEGRRPRRHSRRVACCHLWSYLAPRCCCIPLPSQYRLGNGEFCATVGPVTRTVGILI